MRMSKATISMCMSTTGFGNASTLGTQPLNSPRSYFGSLGSSTQQATSGGAAAEQYPVKRRAQIPQFDMHLKDLFSDEEIANRPLTHQPKIPADFGRRAAPAAPQNQPFMPASYKTEQSTYTIPSPRSSMNTSHFQPQQPPAGLPYQVSNQQPYQHLAETISQTQPNFSFDNLDFLDDFPVADPNGAWSNNAMNDLDLGFGTGGTGYDGNSAWEANGGVDLFDGFFFGNTGGNGY